MISKAITVLLPFLVGAAFEFSPADACLVAYYDFDQKHPTLQVQNKANTGTDDAFSAAYCRSHDSISGKRSLAVDNDEACVPVVKDPSPAITDLGVRVPDFSISLWAKTSNWTTSENIGLVALAKQFKLENENDNQWYVGISIRNRIWFARSGASEAEGNVILGPDAITCETGAYKGWCHLAVTVTQSTANNQVEFYVNGDLKVTNTTLTTPLQDAESPGLFIGSNPPFSENGGNEFDDTFDGLMDEVGIFDKVLTEQDVEALYYGDKPNKLCKVSSKGSKSNSETAGSRMSSKSSKATTSKKTSKSSKA